MADFLIFVLLAVFDGGTSQRKLKVAEVQEGLVKVSYVALQYSGS